MKLIPDTDLIKIPVKDNGEALVDLGEYLPNVKVALAPGLLKQGVTRCMVRETVAKMLRNAERILPESFTFLLRCGHRPISLQKEMWDKTFQKFKEKFPSYSDLEVRKEASKFVCPPDIIPPHSTGGALDLTICNLKGELLDMGTEFGEQTEKSYTDCEDLSLEAKNNRNLLVKVMSNVGFTNYPTEWWHWSYGDRYWAAVKNKESIYSSL
jgi:zinc D-Ala-D-Ala dipeptidase